MRGPRKFTKLLSGGLSAEAHRAKVEASAKSGLPVLLVRHSSGCGSNVGGAVEGSAIVSTAAETTPPKAVNRGQ
jgi:hypothetical protein